MAKKIVRRPKSALHFDKVPVAEVVKAITPDANGRKRSGDPTAESGTRPRGQPRHSHGMHFYNDPDTLCRIVGDFLGEGLEQGALALVIATPEHVARIESHLRARGIDLDDLNRHGRLLTLDAHQTTQLFMMNDMPNADAFRQVFISALTQLRHGREQCDIRAYGEMVDLLWKEGLEGAAIRLETLWNQLAAGHDCRLLCGYSMGNFFKGPAIEEIHDRHTHLIPDDGDATVLRDLQAEPVTLP